ncbi:STAS domain-containing protein [Psychromonas sp. PT13]|uniref:STAS domain-containing protein n=1 Tax=Psychromonas sp. PT13 TaxID=3439547 RepID=UPI003EC04D54
MSQIINDDAMVLTGNLLLNELSNKQFPDPSYYQNVKKIDLQALDNIDSAGIAYLALLKSHHPDLKFVGNSEKINVLANLYGLGFLFK